MIKPSEGTPLSDLQKQIKKYNLKIQKLQSELQRDIGVSIKSIKSEKTRDTLFEAKKKLIFNVIKTDKNLKLVSTRKSTVTFSHKELKFYNDEIKNLKRDFDIQ